MGREEARLVCRKVPFRGASVYQGSTPGRTWWLSQWPELGTVGLGALFEANFNEQKSPSQEIVALGNSWKYYFQKNLP